MITIKTENEEQIKEHRGHLFSTYTKRGRDQAKAYTMRTRGADTPKHVRKKSLSACILQYFHMQGTSTILCFL